MLKVFIINILPPLIGAVAIIVVAIIQSRKHTEAIERIHVSINSRMTEALNAAERMGFAAGEKAEREKHISR